MLGVKHTRLTTTGAIKTTGGRLHWLIISNDNGSNKRACILNNATSGTGSPVAKFWCPPEATVPFYFNPPMNLDTGIYIGTNDNLVVTGGYD